MTSTALIGIDWGTTSFRAHRIDAQGGVIDSHAAPAGILSVPDGDFDGVLVREIGGWLDEMPEIPVIASGMITSRQGWLEVPYCACPAGSEAIAAALMRHPSRPGLHFVPGLSLVGADGVPDVIRGEETQVLGELGDQPGRHLLVLPGTHSKWALVEDGVITWFATFMTGELFGVLKEHSILGRLMQGEGDDHAAFERGLRYARSGESQGGLLKRLFSARTLGLFDILPESGIASYLSGLLIGSEVEEALGCLESSFSRDQPAPPPGHPQHTIAMGVREGERAGTVSPRDTEIRVVGGSQLALHYRHALGARNLRVQAASEDASAKGQFLIARAAGLIA